MDRYAVIGNPIAHSLSPQIHQAFAEQTGQRLTYEKIQAPAGGFSPAAESFFAAGGKGLNVTLPFKQEAFQWVDRARGVAARAKAVNTIDMEAGGTAGHSTDGEGLVKDLRARGVELAGRSLLILGAGGAAQSVLPVLVDDWPARIVVANRTLSRAQELAANYPETVEAAPLAGLPPTFDAIINATSAGLQAHGALIDPGVVQGRFCYDMLYTADGDTPFCRWAKAAGAATATDGLGMLVEQAAAAFAIWRRVHPDTRKVLAGLRYGQ